MDRIEQEVDSGESGQYLQQGADKILMQIVFGLPTSIVAALEGLKLSTDEAIRKINEGDKKAADEAKDKIMRRVMWGEPEEVLTVLRDLILLMEKFLREQKEPDHGS